MFLSKTRVLEATPFSEFIRKADSAKKKRVYSIVLKRASERQRSLIAKASSRVKSSRIKK